MHFPGIRLVEQTERKFRRKESVLETKRVTVIIMSGSFINKSADLKWLLPHYLGVINPHFMTLWHIVFQVFLKPVQSIN